MPEHPMNDPAPTGRALSAAFSFILPGAGQFYQGYARAGLLYLCIAALCWVLVAVLLRVIPTLPAWLILLGLGGHVLAAIDAHRKRPPHQPPDETKSRLP